MNGTQIKGAGKWTPWETKDEGARCLSTLLAS